jgi:hypothetical protein
MSRQLRRFNERVRLEKASELHDLEPTEISLVRKPANRRRFLVVKSDRTLFQILNGLGRLSGPERRGLCSRFGALRKAADAGNDVLFSALEDMSEAQLRTLYLAICKRLHLDPADPDALEQDTDGGEDETGEGDENGAEDDEESDSDEDDEPTLKGRKKIKPPPKEGWPYGRALNDERGKVRSAPPELDAQRVTKADEYNVSLALGMFDRVAKDAGGDRACDGAEAMATKLAPQAAAQYPLAYAHCRSPEAIRAHFLKSDAGQLYRTLLLDPVLRGLPLTEALAAMDPSALKIGLSRAGRHPATVTKAGDVFEPNDFGDGSSYEGNAPRETPSGSTSDGYAREGRAAIPQRKRGESAAEFGRRYNEFKAKVAAGLSRSDREALA